MADQVLSDVDNRVHCGGPDDPIPMKANAAIRPGEPVTQFGETVDEVSPVNGATADHAVMGVAEVPEGGDPDTDIAIGEPVNVHLKGSGAKVWMHLAPAAGPIPVTAGDIIVAHATEVGNVAKADEAAAAAKHLKVVGVATHYCPGHATDELMIRVKI